MRTYSMPGPGFFTFHLGNAYEVNEDGSVPETGSGTTGRFLVFETCSSGTVDFSLTSEAASAGYYGNTKARTEPNRVVVDLEAPVSPAAVTRTP
jgi:hypothetical protein